MNGRVARKSKAGVIPALWLLLWLGFNLCLLLPAGAETVVTGRVAAVLNAKSFRLEDGRVVRLASLQAPNIEDGPGRPGEPLGEVAKAKLSSLISGQTLRLEVEATDRHGRLVAQAYDAKQRWIQGEMLSSGMAMAYSLFPDSATVLPDMLAREKAARAARKGLWNNPYFAVITPEQADHYFNRFKLVEGRVRHVTQKNGHTYLNFGDAWQTDFSCFISRGHAKAFKGMDLKALEGKTIRVRGWIYAFNGPMIDLNWPGQMEVLQ